MKTPTTISATVLVLTALQGCVNLRVESHSYHPQPTPPATQPATPPSDAVLASPETPLADPLPPKAPQTQPAQAIVKEYPGQWTPSPD